MQLLIKQFLTVYFSLSILFSLSAENENQKQRFLDQAENNPSFCGSDKIHQDKMENDSDYRIKHEQLQRIIRKSLHEGGPSFEERLSYDCNPAAAMLTIPIVVHIVHDPSTALGSGENLTDSDVIAVIDAVNDRFAHTSGLTFDNPYSGVDTQIELCIATRDPSGNPSTGILRHPDASLTIHDRSTSTIKSTYGWDQSQYYNFYLVKTICETGNPSAADNCPNPSGVAGYAFLASSHGTVDDGAVFEGDIFWSGLTAHEIGHAFNLLHNFEEGTTAGTCSNANCSTDGDGICDTPPKPNPGGSNFSCDPSNTCNADDDDTDPRNPFRPTSMGGIGNITDGNENYMDYSGGCWQAFTQEQTAVMRTSIISTRTSFLNSLGCTPFSSADAGISNIVYPGDVACESSFAPTVTLKNNGTSNLTAVDITIEYNGVVQYTQAWTGNLAPETTEDVVLPIVNGSNGTHLLYAYTSNPNGGTDGFGTNDNYCNEFDITSAVTSFPYSVNVETGTIPNNWVNSNPDGLVEFAASSNSSCVSNGSSVIEYSSFNTNGSSTGTVDQLLSPPIDLSGYSEADLNFDVAYSRTFNNRTTILDVAVSTDCGVIWTSLYNETEANLATVAGFETAAAWAPSSCAEWRNETINLDSYVGSAILLQFEVVIPEYWGQNLYLDNIFIDGVQGCSPPIPAISPSANTICGTGTVDLVASAIPSAFVGFNYEWFASGNPISGETGQTLTVSSGDTYTVRITDGNCPSALSSAVIINQVNTVSAPFSENLESGTIASIGWLIDNSDAGISWAISTINSCTDNGSRALTIDNYNYNAPGQIDGFVSPPIDLTNFSDASLTFDVAYSPYDASFQDGLNVELSTDCGASYTNEYSKSGLTLGTTGAFTTSSFSPSGCSDWRTETIDLTSYVGNSITIAFNNINGWGNVLWLDNIQISGTPGNSAAAALKLNAFLEGPMESGSTMSTELNSSGMVPNSQPFNAAPWNYGGTETVSSLASNIVDWVLIELLDASDNSVDMRAALLRNDGTITELDGTTEIIFSTATSGNPYKVLLRHRNHIGVMSQSTVSLPNATALDFSQTASVSDGSNQLTTVNGVRVLRAGDTDGDGSITATDFNLYYGESSSLNSYYDADFNLDKIVSVSDFNTYFSNAGHIGVSQIRY